MEKYIPDIYQQSIYTIDYKKLYSRGIKCILFDLDNTLAPINEKEPNDELKKLITKLKNEKFKVIIFSNSYSKRVKPFKDELSIDAFAWALKPFQKKFRLILKEYNYKQNEVVIVGDQMITDIAGGNTAGITTILVSPISKKDFLFTKINRVREKKIMKMLRIKDLFVKGRYYE